MKIFQVPQGSDGPGMKPRQGSGGEEEFALIDIPRTEYLIIQMDRHILRVYTLLWVVDLSDVARVARSPQTLGCK